MTTDTLNPEQIELIDQLIQESAEKLDEAGRENATRAFNLGCAIGVAPALIILAITLILTRSWIAGLMTAILMLVALLGFANLVALISRSNTMKRVYESQVNAEIEYALQTAQVSQAEFQAYAWDNLPHTAPILQFIPRPPAPVQQTKRRFTFPFKLRK